MLSRFLSLLIACTLFVSVYGSATALAAECDPGFVRAECSPGVACVVTEQACVPKVTNGGILPGPSDGATARSYLLGKFLPKITSSFLIFYMVVGTVFLIVSGFMWLMASGNEEMRTKARDTLVWSLAGLTIGVMAYLLVQLVININFFA